MNPPLRISAQPSLTNPTSSEALLPKGTLYNFCFCPWITIIVHCYYPCKPPFVLSIITCPNHKTENADCTFLASILPDPMDNQRIYKCAATHMCPSTKGHLSFFSSV